MSETVFC